MIPFFRNLRRQKFLKERAIEASLWTEVRAQHPILEGLASEEEERLKALATIFLAEKQFELVQGLTLGEPEKLSIAVQACLPVLNLGIDWYNDWNTLIVTPREFTDTRAFHDGHLVHESEEELGGQVLELGPVVLSWADVEDSGWGDGYNVVIHEMAHKLDARQGGVDGCPPLPKGVDYGEWKRVFTEAFEDLSRRAKRLGRKADRELPIDPYAVTDAGEFFAVCCEVFFETPKVLHKEYPEVYRLLGAFFLQDPLNRSRQRPNQLP